MLFAKKKNFTEAHTNLPVELGPESDVLLEKKIAWAKERQAEAEQLALDAARLLSCTDDQLNKLSKQGFFKRCWNAFSGENASLNRANTANLLQMQKMSLRYITMLQEQQLMTAHSLLALRSNLLTLAAKQEETQGLIIALAEKTLARFEALEGRIDQMEITQNLQGWLLTLEDRDYERKFPTPCLRLMRVINDYFGYKKDGWNFNDVLFLKKALRTVRLDPKQELSMDDFIEALVDEISEEGFEAYSELLLAHAPTNVESPCQFLLDNVSLQAVTTVNGLYTQFHEKQEVVEELSENLNCTPEEAFKKLLKGSIARMNVDMAHPVVLSDLAAELLMGLSLGIKLAALSPSEEQHESLEDVVEVSVMEIASETSVQDDTPDAPLADSVTFTVPDGERQVEVTIDWYESKLRLDSQRGEEVRGACSRGREWFVITDEQRDFLSKDGISWSQVRDGRLDKSHATIGIGNCSCVENIFFQHHYHRGQVYSEDGKSWQKVSEAGHGETAQILRYKDRWLQIMDHYSEYSYIEKGRLWDSRKTGLCYTTALHLSDSLDGPWELLASFPQGISIQHISSTGRSKKVFIDNNDIYIFAGYDYSYQSHKNLDYVTGIYKIKNNEYQIEKQRDDGKLKYILSEKSSFFKFKNGNILFVSSGDAAMLSANDDTWKNIHWPCYCSYDNMFFMTNELLVIPSQGTGNFFCSLNGEDFVEISLTDKITLYRYFGEKESILAFDKEGRTYLGKVRKTNS